MSAHTNARLTRAGQRIITTEAGLPLFEVFSGAVGTEQADANEERLVTAWNSHDALVVALQAARQQLVMIESQNHPFEQYEQLTSTIDAALLAAGVEP